MSLQLKEINKVQKRFHYINHQQSSTFDIILGHGKVLELLKGNFRVLCRGQSCLTEYCHIFHIWSTLAGYEESGGGFEPVNQKWRNSLNDLN